MAMWVLGAVLTGVSQNYGSLMFARIFMGAGALITSHVCRADVFAHLKSGSGRGRVSCGHHSILALTACAFYRRGLSHDTVGPICGRCGASQAEGTLVLAAFAVSQPWRSCWCAHWGFPCDELAACCKLKFGVFLQQCSGSHLRLVGCSLRACMIIWALTASCNHLQRELERCDAHAGYMYGEAVASLGWRACFFIEAAFGFPVALLFLFAPAIDLRGEGTEQPGAPRPEWES